MTLDEYNIKIKELRKQRDFHKAESERFDREMNELQIDEQYNNVVKGEYLTLNCNPPHGYTYYFHAKDWEKRPRGIYVDGVGFTTGKNEVRFIDKLSIIYEDFERYKNYMKIIDKKEYEEALENAIKIFKEKFKE